MKSGWILAAAAAVFILYVPGEARAFECPGHIAEARALIDKVNRELESAKDQLPDDGRDMAHSLIDYAEMYLAGASHNHDHAQGPRDHDRAIAKANGALGYARGAERVLARLSK